MTAKAPRPIPKGMVKPLASPPPPKRIISEDVALNDTAKIIKRLISRLTLNGRRNEK